MVVYHQTSILKWLFRVPGGYPTVRSIGKPFAAAAQRLDSVVLSAWHFSEWFTPPWLKRLGGLFCATQTKEFCWQDDVMSLIDSYRYQASQQSTSNHFKLKIVYILIRSLIYSGFQFCIRMIVSYLTSHV